MIENAIGLRKILPLQEVMAPLLQLYLSFLEQLQRGWTAVIVWAVLCELALLRGNQQRHWYDGTVSQW